MQVDRRYRRGARLILALVSAWLAMPAAASAQLSVEDLQEQIDALSGRVAPVGAVAPFTGDPAFVPTGYLLCDGSEVSRTTYGDLFALLGGSHGAGDGSTTFHVPDYRGRFLRGVDAGAGRDPQAAGRTAMNPGGNTGDAQGTLQGDATELPTNTTASAGGHGHAISFTGAHSHGLTDMLVRGIEKGDRDGSPRYLLDEASATASGDVSHGHDASLSGAHSSHAIVGGDAETRPINANVHWIIKH